MSEAVYPLLGLSRHRMGIDGEGVTTLIAGAGCTLSCAYCINKRLLAEKKPKPVTARELYERVKVDDLYFRATNGGVTFGGGESLLHAEFISEFRKLCPWTINVETSLNVPSGNVRLAAESAHRFIVDCKSLDPMVYSRYTGGDESVFEDNLRLLLSLVGSDRITVRVPVIPDYADAESQKKSAEKLREMGVTRLDLFNYVIK